MRTLESQQKKDGEKARRKADAEFEAIRAAKYEEADADIRELKGDRRARGPSRATRATRHSPVHEPPAHR